MANSLIDAYRARAAALGSPDTRDDIEVMQDLIPLADQNPDLLDQYPDFAREYTQYRDAAAPSLAGEFGRAFKAGAEETGATYSGLGALVDIPGAAGEAKKLESEAAENAPTIKSISDIAPGSSVLGKIFSKDALRYIAEKAGGAIPSIGEMAGTALAGAAVGSALEPGVGTVAGAGEGALEGVLGRGIIKKAIQNVIESGAIKDASEGTISLGLQRADPTITDLVTREAKSIAARRAEAATNLVNVGAMGTGGSYNETGDPGAAVLAGALAGVTAAPPFISLPARVAKALFPSLTDAGAKAAGDELVKKSANTLLKRLGRVGEAAAVGTGGAVGMEAAGIVAKNLSQGKSALDLSDDDWKRLREAAIGGAIGSAPFAALAARPIPPTQARTVDLIRPGEALTPSDQPAVPASGEEAPPGPVGAPPDVNPPFEPPEEPPPVPMDVTPKPEPDTVNPSAPEPDETSTLRPEPMAAPVASEQPDLPAAGFRDQAHFESRYADEHERDSYETQDEFLRRVYCQGQAA